jgi:nitrogen fixation/metabolism regulation signal transduction histidine kinase
MKIRTLMIASFLFIAGFTPALTFATQQAVADTNQETKEKIDSSLKVIENSKTTFDSSESMLNHLKAIKTQLDQGELSNAIKTAEDLSESYETFLKASQDLEEHINSSETNLDLQSELETIKTAKEGMGNQIRYITGSVRTGSTLSNTAITDFQSDFHRVASASATINAEVMEGQSRELVSLHESLGDLSNQIVAMGGLVVFISVIIALGASIRLSRPIKELSEEAEKIKHENLDEVNLSRIDTRADELNEFKEVLSDMVLALKAEFNRDRTQMNDLALDVVSELEREVPRGTAESSVTSACNTLDIDPMELKEKDIPELADKLEISMRGLQTDENIFDDIRDLN